MNGCTVDSNRGGGILLNGAAFDIENTTITGNGPGQFTTGAVWGGILVNKPPAAGPTTLKFLTVQANQEIGVDCSAPVSGADGVLASLNAGFDIISTCGFSSCGMASMTCGAQP